MNYTVYKPNAKNTGSLASFKVSQTNKGKDKIAQLFVEFVPQESWDSEQKVGRFSKEKKKCVMFNASEAGEMLACLQNIYPWQTFHKSDTNSTQISFGPWAKEYEFGKGTAGEWVGKKNDFVLSVYSNKVSNKIVLSTGESECLRILLQEFVRLSLTLDGENKDRIFQESQNKNK